MMAKIGKMDTSDDASCHFKFSIFLAASGLYTVGLSVERTVATATGISSKGCKNNEKFRAGPSEPRKKTLLLSIIFILAVY